MMRRPWLRNQIIQHLEGLSGIKRKKNTVCNKNHIFSENEMYHDDLSTSQWNSLMTVACNYIQNDEDMELVRQLESGLLQKLSKIFDFGTNFYFLSCWNCICTMYSKL